jgi:hypothetical protein
MNIYVSIFRNLVKLAKIEIKHQRIVLKHHYIMLKIKTIAKINSII